MFELTTLVPVGAKYAIIDQEDLEKVSQYSWYLHSGPKTSYARAYDPVRKKDILMHRFLLGILDSNIQGDHKNRNGLDNRKRNLRKATHSQNLYNRILVRQKGKSSIYKGVSKFRNKWRAEICVDRRNKYLGLYKTETEAANAYNRAAMKYAGEFAYLNEIKI